MSVTAKRPPTSTFIAGPSKRQRVSTEEEMGDDGESLMGEGSVVLGGGSGSGMSKEEEKVARKEARTIRNRESAQRSRNQRKAHLADLEIRVQELEAENKALRAGSSLSSSSSSSSSSSHGCHTSPTRSLLTSSSNDEGLGPLFPDGLINLASIAPPPQDVKPTLSTLSPRQLEAASVEAVLLDEVRAENTALKKRVRILEELVRQVVGVGSAGNLDSFTTNHDLELPSSISSTSSFPNSLPIVLATTLPTELYDPTTINLDTTNSTDTSISHPPIDMAFFNDLATMPTPTSLPPILSHTIPPNPTHSNSGSSEKPQNSTLNLACHPAVVVTTSSAEVALQRARINHRGVDSTLILGSGSGSGSVEKLITKERLEVVARVVISLARLRGWIPPRSTQSKVIHLRGLRVERRRRRVDWGCAGDMRLRRGWMGKFGMRG